MQHKHNIPTHMIYTAYTHVNTVALTHSQAMLSFLKSQHTLAAHIIMVVSRVA